KTRKLALSSFDEPNYGLLTVPLNGSADLPINRAHQDRILRPLASGITLIPAAPVILSDVVQTFSYCKGSKNNCGEPVLAIDKGNSDIGIGFVIVATKGISHSHAEEYVLFLVDQKVFEVLSSFLLAIPPATLRTPAIRSVKGSYT